MSNKKIEANDGKTLEGVEHITGLFDTSVSADPKFDPEKYDVEYGVSSRGYVGVLVPKKN